MTAVVLLEDHGEVEWEPDHGEEALTDSTGGIQYESGHRT